MAPLKSQTPGDTDKLSGHARKLLADRKKMGLDNIDKKINEVYFQDSQPGKVLRQKRAQAGGPDHVTQSPV